MYYSNISIPLPCYIMGSLFGNTEELIQLCSSEDSTEPKHIILLGDVCLGKMSYTRNVQELFKKLHKEGHQLYILQGLYDDPAYWAVNKYYHAILLKNGSVIKIGGVKTYITSGAMCSRTPEHEAYSDDEDDRYFKLKSGIPIRRPLPAFETAIAKDPDIKIVISSDGPSIPTLWRYSQLLYMEHPPHPALWVHGNSPNNDKLLKCMVGSKKDRCKVYAISSMRYVELNTENLCSVV